MSVPTSSAARISSEPDPAGRIADGVTRLRRHQLGQQTRHGGRGVEFPGLLSSVRRETRDKVDVAFADDVLSDPRRAKVKGRLGEILQHILEPAVAILDPTEIGFGIEVDVAEHTFQLGAVGVLDLLQGDVDLLANIGFVPLFVEVVEAGTLRQDEPLALQPAANTRPVTAVLLAVALDVVVPEIRDVLQEQHHQDVVLVLTGIDDAPEGIASRPSRLVNLLLRELVGHVAFLSCPAVGRMLLARSARILPVSRLRRSAARIVNSLSRPARASMATIFSWVAMSGMSSSSSSRLDRGTIRIFVPYAASSI